MAAHIKAAYGISGRTLYALVRSVAGSVWDGSDFVVYQTANRGDYDVPLSEHSTSGFYSAAFPDTIPGGRYSIDVYERTGASPAEPPTDPLVYVIENYDWIDDGEAGTSEILSRLPAALVGGRMDASMQAAAAGVITAAVIADGAIDAATVGPAREAEVLSYLVDDATRIDASALNTASARVATAVPNVAAGASGGLLVAGSNAATTYASLAVTGALTVGGGVAVTQSTAGGEGVSITGNGTGRGLYIEGGNGSNAAVYVVAGTGGAGLEIQGAGGGNGMIIRGGDVAVGLEVVGGGTSGNAVNIATNSGDGISVTPAGGHALVLTGNGTSKYGAVVTGGTAGTSDGLKLVAGTGGVGLRADTVTVTNALTAGTNAVPWNSDWDAEVQSEADDALVAHRLDELLNADSDIDGAAPPTVGSVFHELLSKTAGSFTYDQTTDSLEALRDRGDAAWTTATGFSTHSAADVWAVGTRTLTAGTNIQLPANGLANVTAWTVDVTGSLSGSVGSVTAAVTVGAMSANVLTASALAADAVSEIQSGLALAADLATVAGYLDTEVAAIKAKTDNLPASPAAVGSAMTLASGAITTASIADDAITDAKIAVPAETAGRPSRVLAMIRRLWEGRHNKRTRNRATGAYALRNAADSGNLETATQSTSGDVDTITQGA